MSDEAVHKTIESYIVATLDPSIKYSMTANNARDFTLAGAPLLSDGVTPFIVFKVAIVQGLAASIGNTTKRRLGIIRAELHLSRDATDREAYAMSDKVTSFLERKSFDGILLHNADAGSEFNRGKWQVRPWTFNFKTTKII